MTRLRNSIGLEEPYSLMEAISDNIETLVSNVRRGKLGARDGKSLSTTAACETVQLMHEIVTLFREHEEQSDSLSNQMLRTNCPADVVATRQVRRLLWLISSAGEAVLRAQFCTLLLTNVTRRVLSFIRHAAMENRASTSELEALALQRLNELDNSDDDYHDRDTSGSQDNSAKRKVDRKEKRESALGRGAEEEEKELRRKQQQEDEASPRLRSLSVRFRFSAATLLGSTQQMWGGDGDDANDPDADEILTIGIPGRQTLRRAPSRREEVDVVRDTEFPVRVGDFFDNVLERIDTFREEIEGMCEDLCSRAQKQLHATDTVITIGCSHTTRHYLLRALAADMSFKVILLDGAPSLSAATLKLAAELRGLNVEVQVLPDSSSFAVMGTCTKVLIGAESVLANGGLLAPVGTHPLCIAAKHFAVPVLVATTTLKMSPYYPRDAYCTSLVKISRSCAQEIPWNTYGSPGDVLPMPYGENLDNIGSFVVHSPVTEYVPPELITLYASNESEYTPSQIHRVVRENYSPED